MSKRGNILYLNSSGVLILLALLWLVFFTTPPSNSGFNSSPKLSAQERLYLDSLRNKYSGTQRTLSPEQLRSVIESACTFISSRKSFENTYDTPDVRELLFGTACAETKLRPRYQDSSGNAIGLFQIEYTTFRDIWQRAIKENHPDLGKDMIKNYAKSNPNDITFEDLQLSDELSAIFARLKYAHIKEPIPPAQDLENQANYYKKYYNTPLGKATVQGYIKAYKEFSEK